MRQRLALACFAILVSVLVFADTASAAIITNFGGNSYGTWGYQSDAGQYITSFQDSFDRTIQGPNSIILLRGGGVEGGGSAIVYAGIDKDTKVAIEGTTFASAGLYIESQIGFRVSVDPVSDMPLLVPGKGYGVMHSFFNWQIRGELAPGDSAYFAIGGFTLSNNGHAITDFGGSELRYHQTEFFSNPLTATSYLPIAVDFERVSNAWDPTPYSSLISRMTIQFNVFHGSTSGQGAAGASWIGFADPDVTSRVIPPTGAVPEPASITLWALGIVACAVAARRRKKVVSSSSSGGVTTSSPLTSS